MRKLSWLLGLILVWLAVPRSASAHADLVWSDPGAGVGYPVGSLSRINLHFDEILEPAFSSIEVYNSRLKRMDEGNIKVDAADPRALIVDVVELPKDTYTVVWLVVSTVDGHSTSGLFNFSVGVEGEGIAPGGIALPKSSSAPPVAWEVGIRWFSFVTAVAAFGSLLLAAVVLYPARPWLGVNDAFWPQVMRRLDAMMLGAIILWLLAALVALGLQTAVVGRAGLLDGLVRGVPFQLLKTRFGFVWLLRLIPALALLAFYWRDHNPQLRITNNRFALKLTLAAALLASLSLTSHGAAGQLWPVLATLVDWLHLLANGAWIGGLLALVLAFLPALRHLPADERHAALRPTLRRFSTLALTSVLIVAVTGAFLTSLHFLVPSDLVDTAYGRAWLVKLALGLLILVFGLANAVALRPAWADRLPLAACWRLSRAVQVEVWLGLIILLATAVLTTIPTPPPRPIDSGRFAFNSELRQIDLPENNLKAFLALAPNYIGWNRYLVVLQDGNGNPIADTERVRIRFTLPEVDARTDWIILTSQPDGLYVTSGRDLVLAGDWQVEVDVRRDGLPDARFSLDWALSAPPTVKIDPRQPRPANWLALGLVGLVAVIPLIRVARSRILAKDEIWPLGRHKRI